MHVSVWEWSFASFALQIANKIPESVAGNR